jgi:hypothetical protein
MPARIRVAGQEHERCTTKHGEFDSMGLSAQKPDHRIGEHLIPWLQCHVCLGNAAASAELHPNQEGKGVAKESRSQIPGL